MLIDDFKARFPEFDAATVDSYWTALEAQWHCYYSVDYGDTSCSDEAILLLIAHLLTVEKKTGEGKIGAVSSQSAGAVSLSFESVPMDASQSFFYSTKYGQRFKMLTRKRIGGFFV